jgi:hypothetical protein
VVGPLALKFREYARETGWFFVVNLWWIDGKCVVICGELDGGFLAAKITTHSVNSFFGFDRLPCLLRCRS